MIVAGLLSVLGTQPAHSTKPDIDAVIDREMAKAGVPGLAYAVVADGAIVASGARGVKRRGSDELVSAQTQFIVGSITKSVTAVAVMQLVEAGEVELGAPISTYLPELQGGPAGDITVAQLLSHTSGFSTLQGNQSQADLAMDFAALARRVEALSGIAPATAPGRGWDYSNANYQLLGRMIEIVSGLDFGTYVETRILAPAGMSNSYVHDAASRPTLATGHRPWFTMKLPLRSNMTGRGSGPQGGVVATAEDLARFLAIMMNGTHDILSAAGKAAMMQPAGPASPNYGYGWFVNADRGLVFHGGANPGYETLATMLPAERKGAVVLLNGGSGLAFGQTQALRLGITAAALGMPYGGEKRPTLLIVAYVALALLPVALILGMVLSWKRRDKLRSQRGARAFIGLGLPVLAAAILAWVLLATVPASFGAPFTAAALFQPDSALLLAAGAAGAVAWAMLRLVLWLTRT
jgi:CubicO group peptidase (beta-lactamase class C family)